MDKLNELKALADLAQQLEDNGHYIEANTVHNKFIRLAQAKTHTVGSGDKLSVIANENGISVNALMKANGLTSSTIYPGDVLKIPAPVKEPSLMESVQKGLGEITNLFTGKKEAPKKPVAPKKPMAPKKPVAPVNKPTTHVVEPGQSLDRIGKMYGVPWQKIKQDNGLDSVNILPGQPLIIKK